MNVPPVKENSALYILEILSVAWLISARAMQQQNRSTGCDLEKLAANVISSTNSNEVWLEKLKLRAHTLQGSSRLDGVKAKQQAVPNIGFDARFHGAKFQLTDHQTVIFNHVQTNQGAGYNVTTGRFTCPQHGIYQFASTTSIPSKALGTIDCEMVRDRIQIGRLHANTKGVDQATQVVVVECRVGQQVWIRHLHRANDTATLIGVTYLPSFSGHLISLM
ncbi:complement C1q-like protein 4 [Ylistrum balloti]|uniref:complement C1q-like protein 4 n=1 Tax=Ylistrum balloti TaxID=509963 RepID=UPI002905EF45|nr:complement C1q-like protein 4 [Ylistrum balloti]